MSAASGIRIILALLLLSGCTQVPRSVFSRADGKPIPVGSSAERQFEIDKTICQGETDKAKLASSPGLLLSGFAIAQHAEDQLLESASANRGCMAQRGYVITSGTSTVPQLVVPESGPAPYYGPVTDIPHS